MSFATKAFPSVDASILSLFSPFLYSPFLALFATSYLPPPIALLLPLALCHLPFHALVLIKRRYSALLLEQVKETCTPSSHPKLSSLTLGGFPAQKTTFYSNLLQATGRYNLGMIFFITISVVAAFRLAVFLKQCLKKSTLSNNYKVKI
jgi:hypothetical protein